MKTEDENTKLENKEETIVRITVTKEADKELDLRVTEVNDGFTAGRVSKQDLASWLIMNFKDLSGGEYIEKVRADFFNELARFKTLLKMAQQSGGLTPYIRKALKELTDEAPKPKKTKKNLKTNHIIDIVAERDAA